jgi:hypothetical protein
MSIEPRYAETQQAPLGAQCESIISLLKELTSVLLRVSYKYFAPGGAKARQLLADAIRHCRRPPTSQS